MRVSPAGPLDPVRDLAQMPTVGSFHTPLPEEYIWTENDAAVFGPHARLREMKRDDWKVEPHCFRRVFSLAEAPKSAALYIAGPRKARVWINGQLAAELTYTPLPHIGFATMTARVEGFLHTGSNTIAIEAVRGYGSNHHTNSVKTKWLNTGEVLAVKILPAPEGIEAKPLLLSDGTWKSHAHPAPGWEQPPFDDAAWKPVVHMGLESSSDFFQWNSDAGMYAWPGYLGEAPYMANYRMAAAKSTPTPTGLLLDFGRELNGRLVIAAGSKPVVARVRLGESLGELRAPFLGTLPLRVPAGHEQRGPKTGFRYALVSFDKGAAGANVEAEGIVYPVRQVGSFASSDAQLNRIWETAVYTAHLSMQDAILDGIKRDRGLWIGDSEPIHRVIADVYGDAQPVKAVLENAIGPAPVREHVNGLPGYSAWWIVAESEYVRRWGDLAQLRAMHPRLVELLARMERELDAESLYVAAGGGKPFVDWAPGLSADSPEARRAVHFEYLLAFRRAATLLELAGDKNTAAHYAARADAMLAAAQKHLRESDGSYGSRLQTNALAALAGAVTNDSEREAAWSVFARVLNDKNSADRITPYFGGYMLEAMARLGHRQEALAWIKQYWGGMLTEGATSFWEAWNPSWAGKDSHAKLEADDQVGYYVSLAHGWSSIPAAWLMEELLGVAALSPGYEQTRIRPDLAGLGEIRGAVATPLGPVHVEATQRRIAIEIPHGMHAEVLLPAGKWKMQSAVLHGEPAEENTRLRIKIDQAGHYEFTKE